MITTYLILDVKTELPIHIGYTTNLFSKYNEYKTRHASKAFGFCPLFLTETKQDAQVLVGELTHLANQHLGTNLIGVPSYASIPPCFITEQGVVLLEVIGEQYVDRLVQEVIGTKQVKSLVHKPAGGRLNQLLDITAQ